MQQAFHSSFPRIRYHAVTCIQISEIIKSLKTGVHIVTTKFLLKRLKLIHPFINSPSTHTCNKILLSGIFFDRLKYAEIKRLLKNGDKRNPSTPD